MIVMIVRPGELLQNGRPVTLPNGYQYAVRAQCLVKSRPNIWRMLPTVRAFVFGLTADNVRQGVLVAFCIDRP